MYLFLTNHRQDVLTSSRKITARKRSPGLAQLNSFEFARDLENQCRSETPLKIFSTVSSQDGRGLAGVPTAAPRIQNNSGLPQGPADLSPGRLLMRQPPAPGGP